MMAKPIEIGMTFWKDTEKKIILLIHTFSSLSTEPYQVEVKVGTKRNNSGVIKSVKSAGFLPVDSPSTNSSLRRKSSMKVDTIQVFLKRLAHNCFKNVRNMKHVTLSQTGDLMPSIGLGTWQAPADVIEKIVLKAFELGYRHIDTAFNYNNEEPIGNAIKKWIECGNGTRKDLFITTKLPNVGNRASDVHKFLDMQLKRLQLEYVDLYLIHMPFAFVCNPKTFTPAVDENGNYVMDLNNDNVMTWKVMEDCVEKCKVRNIGLSNFNENQVSDIINCARIKPQVLQVELHAFLQQPDLRKFCAERDIVVTAFSPLGTPGTKKHFVTKYNYKPEAFPDILNAPEVTELAKRHGKSPAQILLNFMVHQKVVVIPKSTNEKRLAENINIFDFELTPAEMNCLKKLDKGEKARIMNFLMWKGIEKHPEYPFKKPKDHVTRRQ